MVSLALRTFSSSSCTRLCSGGNPETTLGVSHVLGCLQHFLQHFAHIFASVAPCSWVVVALVLDTAASGGWASSHSSWTRFCWRSPLSHSSWTRRSLPPSTQAADTGALALWWLSSSLCSSTRSLVLPFHTALRHGRSRSLVVAVGASWHSSQTRTKSLFGGRLCHTALGYGLRWWLGRTALGHGLCRRSCFSYTAL